jgi:hypothetical protein
MRVMRTLVKRRDGLYSENTVIGVVAPTPT